MDTQEQLKRHQQFIKNQKKQIEQLKERVGRLEDMLAYSIADPHTRWLYANQSERMDANVPIAKEARREFHLDRYRFSAKYLEGRRVGDVACGTGYGCQLMFQQGVKSLIGIDICQQAVEYAQAKYGSENIEFKCASGSDTGLPDASLDGIASFETIEHVDSDSDLLDEFARILVPDGLLICSTPNQWPLEIAPHHVRVYDYVAFVDALNKNFEVVEVYNQNSGSEFKYNHGQDRGIVPSNSNNQETAECFIAVARRR